MAAAAEARPRPQGVECKDWEPDPREPQKPKKCRYYLKGGSCELPSRFMCEEWERANGHAHAAKSLPMAPAAPPTPAPAAPSALAVLTPPPVEKTRPEPNVSPDGALRLTSPEPKPSRAREAARKAYAITFPGAASAVLVDAPPFEPAKEIAPESLAALEALGVEVALAVPPELCPLPVFLVPKHTGEAGRFELTFREAATLRLLVDAFPGARFVKLSPASPSRVVSLPHEPTVDELELAAVDGADDSPTNTGNDKQTPNTGNDKQTPNTGGVEPDPFEL